MDRPTIGLGAAYAHQRLLTDSYRKWTGRELIANDSAASLEDQLFYAPFVLLSHGTEADPVLNYGNEKALQLWEMDWKQLTSTPSRLTAEPMEQEERNRFFEAVTANGYVDNYTGIRISSTGRRFHIMNAVVWNLIDDKGLYKGQAATFAQFRYIG